jgi:hypothetical protein
MTTRRRRARLERLERLQPAPSCPEFIIAPERAQAIIAAYTDLGRLLFRHLWCGIPEHPFGLPDPAAEEETAARLAELLRDVRCPPDYWAKQADADRRDIESYYCDRGSISSDEAVQLRARVIIFQGSPSGAAWRRMMHLTDRHLTPAGQAELADLHRRYPGMPLKDHDPECMRRWKKSMREFDRNAEPIEREDNSTENVLWNIVQQYR